MPSLGKFLLLVGLVTAGIGAVLLLTDKIPFLGKLPGDIAIRKGNVRLYFPLTTSILMSVLISVVLWIVALFREK